MNNHKILALLLASASLACARPPAIAIGEALGMDRTTPDEKAVTTNDPLSLPPDFDLKPPRESAEIGGRAASSAGRSRFE